MIERMIGGYDVAEVACDPFGWQGDIQAWAQMWPDLIVEFPSNNREQMARACDRFRADVLEGRLVHDGDAVLAAHVGHCVSKLTPYGHVVTKAYRDSPRKIDVAVASIIAYDRAMWHAANPRREIEPMVAWR